MGMMLEVTQSWMARLQQVVVPIAAQQIKGRSSWERIVRVRCVAGQHIADARGRHGREKTRYGQGEAAGIPWRARRRMRVAPGE